jgi:hypothetical protein
MDELEQPTGTAPGSCHSCHRWTRVGIVVAEIHSDSVTGARVVRCPPCHVARSPGTAMSRLAS